MIRSGRGASKRFLIAKVGLDGHDRGALVVARYLIDLGHEVIYSGLFNNPSGIARVASHEDVDGVGVSIMSGSPVAIMRDLRKELESIENYQGLLFVGGVITRSDESELINLGVDGIFPTGTPLSQIKSWLGEILSEGSD